MYRDRTRFLRHALVPVALGCAAAAGIAYGQASELTAASVKEFIDSQEKISGGSTVGAIYLGAQDEIDPAALYAFFSTPTRGNLNLTVSSIDGRYSGEIGYTLESPVQGWVRLDFPTEHADFIGRYSIAEIAGLLTGPGGEDCYPLRWGDDAGTGMLRIYINSERAKAFFYRQENGKRSIAYCTAPTSSSGFKFNSICDVPAGQVSANGGIEIHRKFGIRSVDPIQVRLRIDDGEAATGGVD